MWEWRLDHDDLARVGLESGVMKKISELLQVAEQPENFWLRVGTKISLGLYQMIVPKENLNAWDRSIHLDPWNPDVDVQSDG